MAYEIQRINVSDPSDPVYRNAVRNCLEMDSIVYAGHLITFSIYEYNKRKREDQDFIREQKGLRRSFCSVNYVN